MSIKKSAHGRGTRSEKKITVGVIFGGRSGEHEVSIVSAGSVIKNLDKKKYQIIPLGITKEGKWIYKNSPMKQLKTGVKEGTGSLTLPETVVKKIDIFFPVLHGPYGEDGTIQGMFEMMAKPYVGANVLSSALAMDKVLAKQIFNDYKITNAKFDWFLKSEWLKNRSNILRRLTKLSYPLFVKPANLGSSVGISKTHNKQGLIKAINLAGKFDRKILVERAVPNAREIECAVLGNDQPQASVLGEIRPGNEFYDYHAKYVDDNSELIIEPKLSKKLTADIRQLAIEAFQALDICGMARVDFLLNNKTKKVYLNEVNTIPGFTSTISMYPKLWQASGLSYSKLLDKLIQLGIERSEDKNKLSTEFDSGSDWYK